MFILIMTSLKEYLHLYQTRVQLLYCSWQSASATSMGNVELNFSGFFYLFFFTEFLACPLTMNFFIASISVFRSQFAEQYVLDDKLPKITRR